MNLDKDRKDLIQELNFLWRNPKLDEEHRKAVLKLLKESNKILKEQLK